MLTNLKALFSGRRIQSRKTRTISGAGIESLENRTLMTAAPSGISTWAAWEQTSNLDTLFHSSGILQIFANDHDGVRVKVDDVGDDVVVLDLESGENLNFNLANVDHVEFYGSDGPDDFRNYYRELSVTAFGFGGSDYLEGWEGNDYLDGGAGNDELVGFGGSDTLIGGWDNDTLRGGAGNDKYVFDNISLGGTSLGVDSIVENPGQGTDKLDFLGRMNQGVDIDLSSTSQQSVNSALQLKLTNGESIENIDGTHYGDVLRGNSLDNYFYASDGNDVLYGRGGNDRLDGSFHDDEIFGGSGEDRLLGGAGKDTLHGGTGNDKLYGSYGDDVLNGNDDHDELYGESGNDILRGGRGNDRLWGGDHNDTIVGGEGFDILNGDAGNDGLFSGLYAYAEVMVGGTGNDRYLYHGYYSDQKPGGGDVNIYFENRTSDWTEAEIENADQAFAMIQEKTAGNTRLLEDSFSDDNLVFLKHRQGDLGDNVAGNNVWWWKPFTYERRINMVDWNEFSENEQYHARRTFIHEIAHNWDGSPRESTEENHELWDAYDRLSETSTDPEDFAREYGRTNEQEDWATMWEVYVTGQIPADRTWKFYDKLDLVDRFFKLYH